MSQTWERKIRELGLEITQSTSDGSNKTNDENDSPNGSPNRSSNGSWLDHLSRGRRFVLGFAREDDLTRLVKAQDTHFQFDENRIAEIQTGN